MVLNLHYDLDLTCCHFVKQTFLDDLRLCADCVEYSCRFYFFIDFIVYCFQIAVSVK